jgi:Skp family chaperone for outer membrane proteins
LAALVLLVTIIWSLAVAQTARTLPPPPRTGGGNVVLLDVSYIFENHPRFKQMMQDMKRDVQRAEEDVKREREQIRKGYEDLERFKGTAEYKAREEELAKQQNDLNLRIQLQRKEFVQREARIYYNVYQEIQQEVDYYCKQNGVDMVLRFNGDPVDVERPDSVLAFINRPVVWYARERDITPVILEILVKHRGDPRMGDVRGGTQGPTPPPNPFRKPM